MCVWFVFFCLFCFVFSKNFFVFFDSFRCDLCCVFFRTSGLSVSFFLNLARDRGGGSKSFFTPITNATKMPEKETLMF